MAKVTIIKKQPPVDSLALTNNEIARLKGIKAKFDPTSLTEDKDKVILPLIDKFIRPEIRKYKQASDSLYDFNLALDPKYPGVKASDLDKVTGGKGKHMIDVSDTYQGYRSLTDVKSPLKSTPLPIIYNPAGTRSVESTEKLYIPDRELTKKFAATKAKEESAKKGLPKIQPKYK